MFGKGYARFELAGNWLGCSPNYSIMCFCRGVHYLAQRVRERLGYIAEEIKQYDIVGLQEVCLLISSS